MVEALAVILFLPVMLGTALGYCMVRLFVWAWPSLWVLARHDGHEQMRETYDLILQAAPKHSRWRAWFYAFRDLRYCR